MIFIADDQLITPLGFTTEENIAALKNERSGIKKQSNKDVSSEDFFASMIENDVLEEAFSKIGNPNAYTKLEKMLLLAVHGILERQPNLDFEKTALIVSTTKGNIQQLDEKSDFPKEKTKLYELGNTIRQFFHLKTKPITISNACISGGLAIAVAKRFIQSGKYENALVVGGDLVSEFTFSGFNSFQAVSHEPCKPFSKNRTGISLGEAGAALLLSCDETLKSENSIFILGDATANDANHISGPSRTGEGLFLSIQNALKESKIVSKDIDYISAHGTATAFNDEMEAIAFGRAGLLEKPVNSLKGFYGHTLGASALLETIITARSLQNNELYPSLGFDELGVSKPINVITSTQEIPLKTALKTASGFGGCNVALVLQKGEASLDEQSVPSLKGDEESNYIQDFVHLKNNVVFHQEKAIFRADKTLDPKAFAKACYTELGMKYPKFHKMDDLCKLGMIAAETLVKHNAISEDTAVVLANNASSLDTDEKHWKSIQDKANYFPSPAIFVYTLPNIILGEMSIKYGLKSEQVFFVSEEFDAVLMVNYAKQLLNANKTNQVICGWIDLHNDSYRVFLCLLSQKGKIPLTKEKLQSIYNQKS